jgi:hypothetical protein
LAKFGVEVIGDYGYVVKAEWEGKAIDFMFPEAPGGEDYGTVAAAEDFGDII